MIGIYKITNKQNGMVYIGQSNDIQRRFGEHKHRNVLKIDKAIQEFGPDQFDYEVLEECELDELNNKEEYYIKMYGSNLYGYNCSIGGYSQSIGSNNGNAKLNEDDVRIIRSAYADHKRQKEVYEQFKDKITFNNFQSVWQGLTWKDIMPEVYTPENKKYYITEGCRGEKSSSAKLTDAEVMTARKRYVNETAEEIYPEYADRISLSAFKKLLWGYTYKNLPIYSKKEKRWKD